MAVFELEGNNLGEKHRSYNKLFKESLENKILFDKENDIPTLINIDIACANKNVEYILNVFKSSDILYVIRAIQKSTWLITDTKYAYIINPNYLHNELFPQMTTKGHIKLMKNIRHHLKDESRVEEFYNYYSETDVNLAIKWLPNCSVTFIENNIDKHVKDMQSSILKRLCEKSFSIFEKIFQSQIGIANHFETTAFLIRSNPKNYFKLFEQEISHSRYSLHNAKLNSKRTKLLMKSIPNVVFDNFIQWYRHIHIPTFVQYLKRDNVKCFLLEQANKSNEYYHWNSFLQYDTIKVFIKRMPVNKQFEFVKEVFIEKTFADFEESAEKPNSETLGKIKLHQNIRQKDYLWYEFAPFDVAFKELKLLLPECHIEKKYSILTILIKCLDKSLDNTKILLKYFNEKHANDPALNKYDFIKNLILNTDVPHYDEEAWSILNLIYKNMDIYTPKKDDSGEYFSICIESIIIYNVIRGETVPEILKEKFEFNTFKCQITQLGNEEKDKVFEFLYKYLLTKIEAKIISDEESFGIVLDLLEKMFNLLKDWSKELSDYSTVCAKVKELVQLKEKHSWSTSLSPLYSINKPWRKIMFDESIVMNPCEDVCMNALKHDPSLLNRNIDVVEKLCCNNAVSLQRVNRKLRLYWSKTLALELKQLYVKNLNNVEYHKAVIRGIFVVSSYNAVTNIVKKYTPKEAKINWLETNELELSMQRHISENMHLSRPQPHPDIILNYAKGDFLKYALHSLIAVFYNLNVPQSRVHIPKLLNAPVSLQKHGIRFAFIKLSTEELTDICSNLWKNMKNATIRKVLFEFTHKHLCKEKNECNAKICWGLLESFIDNLTYEEDKSIYNLLPETQELPNNIKGYYFVKAYKFLQRLLQNSEKEKETYEHYLDIMVSKTRDLIEYLPSDFLTEMIQQLLEEKFYNIKSQYSLQSANFGVISILSAYILNSKDAEEQMKKYEIILLPLIARSCSLWNDKDKGYIRTHVQEVLKGLKTDLTDIVFDKKAINPFKMFACLQSELKNSFPLSQNYIMLTKWNLTVAFTKVMMDNPRNDEDWDKYCQLYIPIYGEICLEYLKEEVTNHFPRIYLLFTTALRQYCDEFFHRAVICKLYKSCLRDNNFIPGYLAGINLLREFDYPGRSDNTLELVKEIQAHPSLEVKMHFYCIWNKNPITTVDLF